MRLEQYTQETIVDADVVVANECTMAGIRTKAEEV